MDDPMGRTAKSPELKPTFRKRKTIRHVIVNELRTELTMKRIETEQVARDVIRVMAPVVLEQTTTTRRCFHGSLIRGDDGNWGLRGCITHERKGQDGWQEVDGEKLTQMKSGQIRKLDLSREQVRNLSSGLNALTEYAEKHGVDLGFANLVIARRENIVEVGSDRKAIIDQLIQNDDSERRLSGATAPR
jgi:hypothetical protein